MMFFSLCSILVFMAGLHIDHISQQSSNKIHRSIVFFSRLVISVLKREMLLQFMSCVSVTLIYTKQI